MPRSRWPLLVGLGAAVAVLRAVRARRPHDSGLGVAPAVDRDVPDVDTVGPGATRPPMAPTGAPDVTADERGAEPAADTWTEPSTPDEPSAATAAVHTHAAACHGAVEAAQRAVDRLHEALTAALASDGPQEPSTDVAAELDAVRQVAQDLEGAADDAAAPRPDEPTMAGRELADLADAARQVAWRLPPAADAAARWHDAVRRVRTQAGAYVTIAEEGPSSDDPAQLRAAWAAERPPLEALADAARAGTEVPGIEPWASAYLEYATALLTWIDEADRLLDQGDVEAYNVHLAALATVDEQLATAVTAGVPQALQAPAVTELEHLRDDLGSLRGPLDRLTAAGG